MGLSSESAQFSLSFWKPAVILRSFGLDTQVFSILRMNFAGLMQWRKRTRGPDGSRLIPVRSAQVRMMHFLAHEARNPSLLHEDGSIESFLVTAGHR